MKPHNPKYPTYQVGQRWLVDGDVLRSGADKFGLIKVIAATKGEDHLVVMVEQVPHNETWPNGTTQAWLPWWQIQHSIEMGIVTLIDNVGPL